MKQVLVLIVLIIGAFANAHLPSAINNGCFSKPEGNAKIERVSSGYVITGTTAYEEFSLFCTFEDLCTGFRSKQFLIDPNEAVIIRNKYKEMTGFSVKAVHGEQVFSCN